MVHFGRILTKTGQNNFIRLICITGTTAVTFRHLVTDSLAKSQLNEQLVSVHLFSRHGARTPLYLVNGLEEAEYNADLLQPYVKAPYVLKDLDNQEFNDHMSHWDKLNFMNKLKGGAGRGQLTKVGEKQVFELGRRVRNKYMNEIGFLKPDYNPVEFYSRSSHFRRTINSAKSFLAGVFNKSHDEVQEIPFIINVNDLTTDYIFPNSLDCSYYSKMHQYMHQLEFFKKNKTYMEDLKKLNKKIFNTDDEKSITFTRFRDDMIARHIHDLPVPEHLETEFERSHSLASKELSALSKHSLKISCGRLLHHVMNNLNDMTKKDTSNHTDFFKFRYYSVHDTTLNALMHSFEIIDEDTEVWPPFAADVVIELWKDVDAETNNNEYFVRVFYCDGPMKFKNDKFKCKLSDFIEILKRHETSQDHYNHLCSKAFEE